MSGPAEEFAELVGSPAPDIRLDHGALLIAKHVRSGLEFGAWYAHLDDLAARCPEHSFDALRHHLFDAEGFAGNDRDYADPENSMLDSVLTTRVGIPITLSVVAIEVGRRLGVEVNGVGMPGHFLIGDASRPDLFCDPFHGSRALAVDDCRALFDAVHGDSRPFTPEVDLVAVSSRAILARMLANLENGPLATDPVHLAWMCRAHLAIPGLSPGERLGLAQRLSSVDVWRAADEFEHVADIAEEQVAKKLRVEARRLRARAN